MMLDLIFFCIHLPFMQFSFVESWVTLGIILYGVTHGHRQFVFGVEVKHIDCIFAVQQICSENS